MNAASVHPCFNRSLRGTHARMHLPVAPRCNISCAYCSREYSCINESRPGVSAALLSPEQALHEVRIAVSRLPELSVIGIAGPGDPLANPAETLETLRLVRRDFPHLLLCLSCNGLALPAYAEELVRLGVRHVTVTVNAVDPAIGARICRITEDRGAARPSGEQGAQLLLERQKQGVRRLKSLGATVKINTVVIPQVNEAHVPEVAERVRAWGADLMNCIPMIPVPGTLFGGLPEPDPERMKRLREAAGRFLPQMSHCVRCRADAVGLLGARGTISDLHGPEQSGGERFRHCMHRAV